jgi:hypothetical protein
VTKKDTISATLSNDDSLEVCYDGAILTIRVTSPDGKAVLLKQLSNFDLTGDATYSPHPEEDKKAREKRAITIAMD